ncbi:MAG: cation:proton antiporter [Longimicrobiales bacterium]
MARFLTLIAFVGLMHAVGLLRAPGTPHGTATLFLGFLLLVSYPARRAARVISLPRITGYLVVGILVGPYVLGILPRQVVQEFRFVNGVALALIALSAGGELRMESLRSRIRSIGTITVLQISIMFSMVAATVFLARGSIGFLQEQPRRVAVAVSLLFGLVAVAKSPATTIAMAAGFSVQNFSRQGRRLLHALEANSLPFYALFFALAGADMNLEVLGKAWVIATAIVAIRVLALWLSTYLGARMAGDPPAVRHHAWLGFLAQAGITLGIANIVRERFPVWGVHVATIIIATIAVNQLVGPPAFRWAIIHSGESHVPHVKGGG